MDVSMFVPVTGSIMNITRGFDCCSQMVSLRAEGGIVNFVIDPQTMVVDCRKLRPGMRITVFYDSSLPVPLIFPPQYRAKLIAVMGRNEQVMLNYFNRDLVAEDQSLSLNLSGNTTIQTMNEQNYTCSPGENVLLVFYSVTTRSIPPQTTPRKIVVLC